MNSSALSESRTMVKPVFNLSKLKYRAYNRRNPPQKPMVISDAIRLLSSARRKALPFVKLNEEIDVFDIDIGIGFICHRSAIPVILA